MATIYLVVAFVGGQNPFVDRSFLITVNGLLIVVLGITVLSIAERGEQAEVGWIDYINVALLVVTLVIDLIALSAIFFRLTSYGFTPNRVVVLGANLVVMAHLALTCRASIGLIRGRSGPESMRHAVAGYLPVYVGWAALVAFVLPLVFRFG
jgi:fumarate reductase subunit C